VCLALGLADIAVYVKQFRAAHEDTRDSAQAWRSLTSAEQFEVPTNGH
jgi:hypothetical protein